MSRPPSTTLAASVCANLPFWTLPEVRSNMPLKSALPIEWSLAATVALCALLYAIVKWKDRKMAGRQLPGVWRIFTPVLK